MSDTTITRRRTLGAGTLFLGAGLLGAADTTTVVAETIAPGRRGPRAARPRGADLMLTELRWDDEGRLDLAIAADLLHDLGVARDPQNPRHIRGWPASA